MNDEMLKKYSKIDQKHIINLGIIFGFVVWSVYIRKYLQWYVYVFLVLPYRISQQIRISRRRRLIRILSRRLIRISRRLTIIIIIIIRIRVFYLSIYL